MQSFLSKVAKHIISKHGDLSHIQCILPSKRAGLFLKSEIKNQLSNSSILPRILSIEDFVKGIANLDQIDNIALIFQFYTVYKKLSTEDNLESFESFSKWASILIQDFNELDSNLMDAEAILSYVNDSKRIERWNLQKDGHSKLSRNYLAFYDKVKIYYANLNTHLLNQKLGYQGLIYKKAYQNLEVFIKNNKNTKFVFAGFNALNKAEEKIFQEIIQKTNADIFWDNDEFYKSTRNIAGKYFRKYKKSWAYYNTHKFNWQEKNIDTSKNVFLIGMPKNITQIKKAGEILDKINKENQIQKTALILGNEKLLPLVLNAIPKGINHINITMGYDLNNIPLADFFNGLFQLHLNRNDQNNSFYYKNFLQVINQPLLYKFWSKNKDFSNKLKRLIYHNKTIFISKNDIDKLLEKSFDLIDIFKILFGNWDDKVDLILHNFNLIIDFFRKEPSLKPLEKEYLYRFNNIFQQLINLNNDFGYITNIKTLYIFYQQILKTENLSFQGEPLKGLQIMGVLESRVLDFENVIITSVNEGHLPSGGAQNSFIPLDIKREKGMPTYKEKDSIFAYHFFRLFHRAKNIYILYNTETDDFGSGEQSRFITQLEIAKENNLLKNVNYYKSIVIPKLKSSPISLKEVRKTHDTYHRLKEIATKGLSPSALGMYIRNPIDFYKRKILDLKEFKEVEETIAANTFGTIIHDTLDVFYKPFKNKYLTIANIDAMKSKLNDEVLQQFRNHYSTHAISSGKNYLIFEIAKQFLINFLNSEISELKKIKKIKIIDLELDIQCDYRIEELPFTLKLKGQIDRIDEVDGVLRIIDYKTGKVEKNQLKIDDWDLLVSDEKYSKSFQILMYAYMYSKVHHINFEIDKLESGIISFRNIKSGYMKFNGSIISTDIMDNFLIQLKKLILEIFNEEITFKEKELQQFNF